MSALKPYKNFRLEQREMNNKRQKVASSDTIKMTFYFLL